MSILRTVTAIFFPERCPYCGAMLEPCEIACENCLDEISRKHQVIKGGVKGFRCISSFAYGGKVRRMILRVKYRSRTQFIPQVSEILARDILTEYGEDAFDLITAVPMHWFDQKTREYNQSKLLAQSVGKLLRIPYQDTLVKVRRTKKQHNLKYAQRKTNLSGAFRLRENVDLKDKRILIIDDIITSGYTLGYCCKALSKAKPAMICCATIASARNKYPESTLI